MIDPRTVFTKTAKGVTQVNQRTQSLARDLTRVLKSIDGKSTVAQLAASIEMHLVDVQKALAQLERDRFTKIFEIKVEVPLSDFGGMDDFDFTPQQAPGKAPANAEAGFHASPFRAGRLADQVEHIADTPASRVLDVEAAIARDKARLEAERQQRETDQVQAKILAARQLEAKQAQADARARVEREAQLRARLEVEMQARKDAEHRAMQEAERAQAAAEAARQALEAKLAEEQRQRDSFSDTRTRLTRAQIERETEQQRALAALRAQAEAEAQALAKARAEAEAEARALAEARKQAEQSTKNQAVEFEAAQRELRQQLKAEIEAKVRAEMEVMLRSDIEESARSEVEEAVRGEAQEDARRQLEARLSEERVLLARAADEAKLRAEIDAKAMLAEQETRIRTEMEARITLIAEERSRAEVEARRMAEEQAEAASKTAADFAVRLKTAEDARRAAEAEAAARRDVENRVRAEAEEKNFADLEARKQAEAEAMKAKQHAESLSSELKAEAEARRAAEDKAQQQREIEVRNRSRLEARAREDADARSRLETEMSQKIALEREATQRAEAQTLLQQELREKDAKKSKSALKAEKRARADAEQKAASEAESREIAARAAREQITKREQIERESQKKVAEARAAQERAEERMRLDEEAEEKSRQSQLERLRELGEQNEQAAAARAAEAAKPWKRGKGRGASRSWFKWIGGGVFALVVAALAVAHVAPLGPINARLEKSLSAWFHDDVSSGNAKFSLFPSPHLKIDSVALGKLLDAKADSGRLYMDLASLAGDKFFVDTLELNDITLTQDSLQRAVNWADRENRGRGIAIDRIALKNVKLVVPGVNIDPFDADIRLDKKGAIIAVNARAGGGKWNLVMRPDKAAPSDVAEGKPVTPSWSVDFSARNIVLPISTPLPLSEVKAKGTWAGQGITFPQVEFSSLEGTGTGTLVADWSRGISFTSKFTVQRINTALLAEVFTRDIALAGRMHGDFTAAGNAPMMGQLLAKPRVNGSYTVTDGAISNVDLVQAMRSPDTAGRGGQTKFTELTGQLSTSDGSIRFERVRLDGGVLSANATLAVTASNGVVSGNINSEIRSSVAQDRAAFSVSGNVARPVLKRGG